MNIVNNLIGEEGAKFDITVDLSRQTMVELFSALLLVSIIAVAIHIVVSKILA